MFLINDSKQWFVKMFQRDFSRTLSYEEKWRNNYFKKEVG